MYLFKYTLIGYRSAQFMRRTLHFRVCCSQQFPIQVLNPRGGGAYILWFTDRLFRCITTLQHDISIYLYIYIHVCVNYSTSYLLATRTAVNTCNICCLFYFKWDGISDIYSYGSDEVIRGSLNRFPDFFRMGTFIDSTHMKLLSPSK